MVSYGIILNENKNRKKYRNIGRSSPPPTLPSYGILNENRNGK